MAALQLRRGIKANLPAIAVVGEPLIATDTRELYIGTGTGTYKVGDVVFGAVAPTVEPEKIWINTTSNEIYRADNGAWVKCAGAVDLSGLIPKTDIDTTITLGTSTTKVPSQSAVKSYVDTAIGTVDTSALVPKTDIDTSITLGTSTTKVPSQSAVKSYVDTSIGNVDLSTLVPKADIDTTVSLGISDTKVPSQAAVKSYVDTAILSLVIPTEWPNSVLDQVTTPTTTVEGVRYLVIATATGVFAGYENQIAEYKNAAWVFTAPTTGVFVSIDSDTTGLYYYGGSGWVKKSFETTSVDKGLTLTNGKIGVDPTIAGSGLAWDADLGVLSIGTIDGGTF
jgi:hypothetical protein